ncbi:MAG: ABC transporter substrate-binding protein, partial [Burkholderiales bacterium]|nr:ABC transporter substrate-binding protein [Burkholderiales bacterium]
MRIVTFLAACLALAAAQLAQAQTAICYNCPPEWADWGTELRAIQEHTGVTVPPDNKNSGQSLAQLVAERASPVADMTYLGVTFGIQARQAGVTAAYKPAHWDEIPAGLKDPEGHWFTIHSGTLGFMVNVDALHGKPVPR